MLRRSRKRAKSSKRIDDNPDAFKKRLDTRDTYRKESLPVVDHLRGTGTVKTVCSRLCNLYWACTNKISKVNCSGSPEDVYGLLGPDSSICLAPLMDRTRRDRWTRRWRIHPEMQWGTVSSVFTNLACIGKPQILINSAMNFLGQGSELPHCLSKVRAWDLERK